MDRAEEDLQLGREASERRSEFQILFMRTSSFDRLPTVVVRMITKKLQTDPWNISGNLGLLWQPQKMMNKSTHEHKFGFFRLPRWF